MSTSNVNLSYLTIPALKKHNATVIFAHGIGESGHVWKPFAYQIQFATATLQHTKWILLHAPKRLTTTDDKVAMMPSWFDSDFSSGNESQLLENAESLNKLIEKEMEDSQLSSDRIFLGGYGQGGMMIFGTGLTLNKWVGGLIVLNAALPMKFQLKQMLSLHAKQIPIFWSAGAAEPAISIERARESVEFLDQLGFTVSTGIDNRPMGITFNVYRGSGHAADKQEIEDLTKWLNRACLVVSHQRL
ncbi:hypothetical protein GYMLUDRAFT_36359 [Collybiopsis luxurians FD-317 M1]|nr:hypothetical protein GYMLUDRAFT_36359 [Collybiopsis luxurians FD-317 M1]